MNHIQDNLSIYLSILAMVISTTTVFFQIFVIDKDIKKFYEKYKEFYENNDNFWTITYYDEPENDK